MTQWIYTGFVGLICGICARFFLPGRDPIGLIGTIIVGILGAYVGTALGTALGMMKQGEKAGWLWSIIGAMVVLFGLRFLM